MSSMAHAEKKAGETDLNEGYNQPVGLAAHFGRMILIVFFHPFAPVCLGRLDDGAGDEFCDDG